MSRLCLTKFINVEADVESLPKKPKVKPIKQSRFNSSKKIREKSSGRYADYADLFKNHSYLPKVIS